MQDVELDAGGIDSIQAKGYFSIRPSVENKHVSNILKDPNNP